MAYWSKVRIHKCAYSAEAYKKPFKMHLALGENDLMYGENLHCYIHFCNYLAIGVSCKQNLLHKPWYIKVLSENGKDEAWKSLVPQNKDRPVTIWCLCDSPPCIHDPCISEEVGVFLSREQWGEFLLCCHLVMQKLSVCRVANQPFCWFSAGCGKSAL